MPRTRLPRLRGLFQQRVAGDDALLQLARLRFEQAGLGAELHAGSPAELERMLTFAPASEVLPTVHLPRGLDLLAPADCATVAEFAQRFAGRIAGFVAHDQRRMVDRTDHLVHALERLDAEIAGSGPMVFLEYASNHPLEWFGGLAERLAGVASVSVCIDIGHVGVAESRRAFAALHPGVEVTSLQADPERLAAMAEDLQHAAGAALPAVLELTRVVCRLGKPVHFHLHDGHPLIPRLSDHFSFLMRPAVPIMYSGRRSLDPMFGPDGARAIVAAAEGVTGAEPSFTLEIHQARGRRPLDDAAGMFDHWTDLTNAERTNHWLAVLAENAVLL